VAVNPYPDWLSAGDNAWQLMAATLVGLMSIPGLALLYGGLVARKWAVNTMLMAFSAFALVLVGWVLYGFSMGFGRPLHLGPGILGSFVGIPHPILDHRSLQGRASIPLLDGAMPAFRFPKSTLAYFQFAFAAITPLLFLGSVLGRMSFRAWLVFVPVWSALVYSVNAFLLWGGGWWAHQGALDYSGGYVIHLAAGTTGFTAAAVIGPRLAQDRVRPLPNNLPIVAAGAGILWLGWNGFNGGDMYFGGANAAAAVLNTNLATAVALLTWLALDMTAGRQRKPTFLGAINGMISGLVAITPAAGFVNGWGALLIGLVAGGVVWLSWNKLSRVALIRKVDDAMGVLHTHGVAGLTGGLLVGLLADPAMTVYLGSADGRVPGFSVSGLFYGNPKQVGLQLGAAVTVIVWDAVMTVLILKVIGRFIALRLPDEVLESGDLGVHDEEAYPGEPAAGVTVARAVAPPPAAPAPPPAAPAPPPTAPAPPDAPAAPPGVARAPVDQGPP
jgi:Amt family ammonium transporter